MKVSEDMLYPFPLRRCGGCDDANDGVCQEVGDVRREVAGELGGKPTVCLIRAGCWFRRHVITDLGVIASVFILRVVNIVSGVLDKLEA